jgi:DNA-binding response OmpR family regulator
MLRRKRPRRVLIAFEAQARALRTSPDLIILDIAMPGRTGLEVMAALRANPETKDIPVVLLTARSSDADIWEGWKSGAAYYLTKPFDTAQLMHFVNSMFDHKAHAR